MAAVFVKMALCSDGVVRAIYKYGLRTAICVDGDYHYRGWRGITW
jgi:hypothetical protein